MTERPTRVYLAIEAATWIGITEEGGDNRGPEVEEFQRAVNPSPSGESWCMDFVQFCVQKVAARMGVVSVIHSSESVLDVWNKTPITQRTQTPEDGAVAIWEHGTTGLGHCGIVFCVFNAQEFCTIEGNTAPGMNIERNGDGVFAKKRLLAATASSEFKLLGFLRVFP